MALCSAPLESSAVVCFVTSGPRPTGRRVQKQKYVCREGGVARQINIQGEICWQEQLRQDIPGLLQAVQPVQSVSGRGRKPPGAGMPQRERREATAAGAFQGALLGPDVPCLLARDPRTLLPPIGGASHGPVSLLHFHGLQAAFPLRPN
ncbi:hypothetical protein NDU88_004921 [Pleurodeles waltl]|uniref:Uncharacterized protein n=1 Tax=Pleurodeles waltl TaxID=8319 RepID=A0AAV7L2Q9_PLEWA|nr:hypothetical protein NDU88_004921 [Pleurodeles waltl]